MRVLVTGASGRIGTSFAAACENGGLELVRADVIKPSLESPFPYAALDVTDMHACREACRDMDAVLHLAADPSPAADFRSSVLPVNIVGTYNIATAAVAAEVKRLVFASSVQAVQGYPLDYQVRETDAPWPANDYGVGKAFGEALCASLAACSATSFVAVRIGNYSPQAPKGDSPLDNRAAWVSPRDANQLLTLALIAESREHIVAHAISNNSIKRLSILATTATLGYNPVDDAFVASRRPVVP